jgi:hypothetical protein
MMCLAPTPEVALAFYALMLFPTNWTTSSTMTGLAQITPNELRGQIVALYTLLTGIISLTVGSFSVGFLSDRVFVGAKGIAPSLATVLGFSGLAATATLIYGRAAFRIAAQRAEAWHERV